jgi:DNA-binding NarL/FixJ family response regulator
MLEGLAGRPLGRRVQLPGGQTVSLTPREWQVLDELAGGATTGAIATHTGMSEATVRSHVAGIVRKLGVPDRAAAVELARRNLERE